MKLDVFLAPKVILSDMRTHAKVYVATAFYRPLSDIERDIRPKLKAMFLKNQ